MKTVSLPPSKQVHQTLATWVLTALLLTISCQAFANPREKLLALDHRPTVQEVQEALKGSKTDFPFGMPTLGLQETILKNLPSVIAAFEKAFPGATFVALGRDAVFLGDVIDAYYLSLGQRGRVLRIDASGASRTNDSDLVDYLKGIGFDLTDFESRPPFIIFDQTRFNSGSQSTTYLRAVYNACRETPSCDPKRLLEKFNFINTGSKLQDMYKQNVISPTTDLELFLSAREASLATIPNAILSVTVDETLTYTTEYHDTFGKFTRLSDGRIITKAGKMSTDATRLKVLADVLESANTVATPEFHQRVQEEASKLGYTFPRTRAKSAADLQIVDTFTSERERLQAYLKDESLDANTRAYVEKIVLDRKAFDSVREQKRLIRLFFAARNFDEAFSPIASVADFNDPIYLQFIREEEVLQKILDTARLEGKIPETLKAYDAKQMTPDLFYLFARLELTQTPEEFLAVFEPYSDFIHFSDRVMVFTRSLEKYGTHDGFELLVKLLFKSGGSVETFNKWLSFCQFGSVVARYDLRIRFLNVAIFHLLDHIQTREDLRKVEMPAPIRQSKELKQKIRAWKKSHESPYGFRMLIRSCTRSLMGGE